jgi:peptidyl-prolyl cis-trans isomerase D
VLQTMRSSAKYIFWILLVAFVGGFLLAETSGLIGRAPVTATSVVAEVNGRDILYQNYLAASQQLIQQEEQRAGRGLTLDERQRLENQAFDQMVNDILLQEEFERRGIQVTSEEIIEAARFAPPQGLMEAPELQTEGRFDPEKYQRFLASPAARQQGILAQLEAYYRSEIPRQKLFAQIASDVYVSDQRLWFAYKDTHDSAQVSFVSFDLSRIPDAQAPVSDAEVRERYNARRASYERPGRAVVSVIRIPRIVSPADSAAARARIQGLRDEILAGAKFEDVARRESADTASGSAGGDLGRGPRGRFVPQFESAAYALQPGQLSEPVLSPFGYHLIKVDSRAGDTLALRHILIRITQSDSSAVRTDRRADSLAAMAASQEDPQKFDSAAAVLGIPIERYAALEGENLMDAGGRYVPSVSAWAFSGARPGETSDLLDSEEAYFLARLDSITESGAQSMDAVRAEIERELRNEKKVALLVPQAQAFATKAAASSLEAAAREAGMPLESSPVFARVTPVLGLGRVNQAIGAAFTLPIGAVGAPVATDNAVIVMRVNRRTEASRAAFEAQKTEQRQTLVQGLREQRVRDYLANLRKTASVEDKRKELLAASRRGAGT